MTDCLPNWTAEKGEERVMFERETSMSTAVLDRDLVKQTLEKCFVEVLLSRFT